MDALETVTLIVSIVAALVAVTAAVIAVRSRRG